MSPHIANSEQRRASDPTASAWVNANAGSGKTHVLVDRLIRLMLAGSPPSRILCLTFTKAAAAEMSNRLFARLGRWTALDDRQLTDELAAIGVTEIDLPLLAAARRLFTRTLETPGGLKIQTIHAFCERLLQLFPVEAGIVPRFEVMDEQASARLMADARNAVLAEALREPETALGKAVAAVTAELNAEAFDALLGTAIRERARIAEFLEPGIGAVRAEAGLRAALELGPGEDEAAVKASLPLDAAEYARAAAALDTGTGKDCERAATLRAAMARGADLFALRGVFLTGKNEPSALSSVVGKQALRDSDAWLAAFVTREQQRLVTALGKLADLEHLAATLSLLTVAAAVLEAFAAAKRRRGAYDFDDLILLTRQLLADKSDAQWVLFKLDGGIDHILLDEAQDTSPAQWSILTALTEEFFAGAGRSSTPRTLFVVGDRKQSIYSFQGADPDYFATAHRMFEARLEGAPEPLRDVDFSVSFRSAPEILEAVDGVFAEGAPARAGLVGRDDKSFLHQSNRLGAQGTVELWPMIEPDEVETPEPWQFPVDREPANAPRRKLARRIAATVKAWIGQRRLSGSDRAVQPGDILILVRTRNAFFDALVRELRAAGVPVAGADRLRLGDSLAVQDVLALARACLLEPDDYALACVLKSPLLSAPLGEEQLFALAHDRGPATLWHRLARSASPEAQAAYRVLAAYREQAGRLRPFEFLAGVIAEALPRFLARLGSEAGDALDALLDRVLAYEGENPASLQGFLAWFAGASVEIKRNMEQAAGEVRIMTVHGAKGLEAPIVILPDTVGVPDSRTGNPLRFLRIGDSDRKLPVWQLSKRHESAPMRAIKQALGDDRLAEYQRLLYVAMTRPRDELYIAGYRGTHAPKEECWYHAVATALGPKIAVGGGQGPAAAAPQASGTAGAGGEAPPSLPGWLAAPPPPETAVAPVLRPSQLAAHTPEDLAAISRGLVVHRVLQLMPGVPPGERLAIIRRVVARAGQAPALADELAALIARPEIAALLGDDGLSEVPLRATLADGRLITGRIDRLILRPDEILIVDYKTDRLCPETPEAVAPAYLAQLAAYQAALTAIHQGLPVRAGILWTSLPRLMHIPDMVLAAAAATISGVGLDPEKPPP